MHGHSLSGAPECFNEADARAALKSGVFGAAAGDLSPILSAGLCDGSQNTTEPKYNMDLWCVSHTTKFSSLATFRMS